MSSRNTGEEARQRIAEEEKELDASIDHERLARLVAANSPSTIEDGRRAEAEAQRRLEEAHRRAEAERSDKKRPRNLSADASGYAPVLPKQQPPPSAFYQPVASAHTSAAGKRSLMPFMLIAAVLFIAILGGGIGAYLMLSSGSSSGEKSTQTSPSRPGDAPNRRGPVDTRQEMIAIPGGTFMMGQNGGPPAEAPAHSVTVSDFSMDKTEVTNAEYAEFVNETKRTPPQHWPGGKVLSGQE
ncbi:MAG TPA: SUMF1/EgtB/PvdO family nonheme iron enzyme, partial [Pyrinomonadaceae bacterium]